MIKSKRGRKPKIKPPEDLSNNIVENTAHEVTQVTNLPKKRGRKPKGGKIVQTTSVINKMIHTMPNIILHLHCTINDVNTTFNKNDNYDPTVISVENYDDKDNFFKSNFTVLSNDYNKISDSNKDLMINNQEINPVNTNNSDIISTLNSNVNGTINSNLNNNANNNPNSSINTNDSISVNDSKVNMKNVSKKLKELSYKLRNNICDNKSACFWCTCKFNTGNIYIPKNLDKDYINVYGCFCSPECATSFLMNEHIDTSIKFERYSLINYIYGSIYNYKKNIKPAPNPYYVLDKYCGNLTIEEYRSQFTDDNLLIVANKPQSRILPELFEENNMSSNDMRYSINKYS